MPKGKKNKKKNNVLKGTITSLDTLEYFTVDEDKKVRISPNTVIRGVAVGPTSLLVGQQVVAVGDKKDGIFHAKKINVETADGPEPEEPEEEPEPEPEPTPEPEPAPGDDTPPADDEDSTS